MNIVFTNGCFDNLHHGHIKLLRAARAAGDYLIVAVNTDASVRALKGPERPLWPLERRMRALQRLLCIDAVIPFDGDVHALVATIHPDIIVKGSDYTEWNMAGADIVKARGGRVLIVDRLPGYSTTELAHASQ